MSGFTEEELRTNERIIGNSEYPLFLVCSYPSWWQKLLWRILGVKVRSR